MYRAAVRGGMAVLMLTLGLCAAASAQVLEVAVSVLPQKHFVERVGGHRVRVTAMVQPGQSPHTYEPTPRQVGEITAADVYFSMGVGFESSWLPRLREISPEMRVVDLRTGIALRAIEGHGHAAGAGRGPESGPDHAGGGGQGHGKAHGQHAARARDHGHSAHAGDGGHGHGADAGRTHTQGGAGHAHAPEEPDPHVWTDPRNVVTMAATIRDTLSDLDPAGSEGYRRRFEAFRESLLELDAEIEALLSDLGNRRFMVYHPSWGYFADRYRLKQLPIELEGKAPGPASLARVIDTAREAEVRVIFVQPQFSERSARRVAEAIDGEVLAVDPLAEDYAANLRRVARALRTGMR